MTSKQITQKEIELDLLYKLEGYTAIKMSENDQYEIDVQIALSDLINKYKSQTIKQIDFKQVKQIILDNEIDLKKVRAFLIETGLIEK